MTTSFGRPKIEKIGDGTFGAVIGAFLDSAKFTEPPPVGLAPNTKKTWRLYLSLANRPTGIGSVTVEVIRPSLVQKFLDAVLIANGPGAQGVCRTALIAVEKWAVVRDHVPFPFMTGTEAVGSDGGHIPWTNAQVELAEKHARPDLARVITLAANTGQRGSDLVRMTWTDIEHVEGRPGINVGTQKVRGQKLWIPMTQPLQAAIGRWREEKATARRQRGEDTVLPLDASCLLLKEDGTRWSGRHQMSENWNRERDRNPALVPCRNVEVPELGETRNLVLHGLRATACVRLWEAGCPITLISNMVGLSVAMVARYVRFNQKRSGAMAAVGYLDRKAGRTENEHQLRKSDQNG